MRLVQGDLEYTGNDLGAAGQALGRSVDERQPIGCQTAVMGNLGNQSGRRRTAALEDECACRGVVLVRKLFEQRFDPCKRPRRAGAESDERVLALLL